MTRSLSEDKTSRMMLRVQKKKVKRRTRTVMDRPGLKPVVSKLQRVG
jgi:hypothetical protein